MDFTRFFPDTIQSALKNDPPGEWMPTLPSECIRLHSGYPAPELIPQNDMRLAVDQLILEEHDLPFHYIGSPHMAGLQALVKTRLKTRGIHADDSELLITSGACQAIDLIARVFADDSTVIVVESPTYMEALEIFKNYTSQFIEIPLDEDGIRTDVLEVHLRERQKRGQVMPRFLYTIPSFQNPSGTCLIPERRQRLLELANEFDFLIVEDDAYGELSFGDSPVPLKALDRSGRVIHVGSLSKVVAPGMRVGWIVAPKPLIDATAWFKKDLEHPFGQAVMATYLEALDFDARIRELRDAYRHRRDVMIGALSRTMPKSVRWQVPDGGYFVWLHVPGVNTLEMLSQSLDAGVSYIPGAYFFGHRSDGSEHLRLAFSYIDLETMVEGIERLAKVIRIAMEA